MGLAVLTLWLRDVPEPRWARRARAGRGRVAAIAFVVVSIGIGIGDRLFEAMTPEQYLGAPLPLRADRRSRCSRPAVIGTTRRRRRSRAVLGQPRLAWLGLVSYGIYLWHDTVLALAGAAGTSTASTSRIPTSRGRSPGSPAPR